MAIHEPQGPEWLARAQRGRDRSDLRELALEMLRRRRVGDRLFDASDLPEGFLWRTSVLTLELHASTGLKSGEQGQNPVTDPPCLKSRPSSRGAVSVQIIGRTMSPRRLCGASCVAT